MKKSILLILTELVFIFSAISSSGITTTTISKNLLTNPSFENWINGKPVGWSARSIDSINTKLIQEQTLVSNGNSSFKVINKPIVHFTNKFYP